VLMLLLINTLNFYSHSHNMVCRASDGRDGVWRMEFGRGNVLEGKCREEIDEVAADVQSVL